MALSDVVTEIRSIGKYYVERSMITCKTASEPTHCKMNCGHYRHQLNPFPHGKILDQTKWKALADDKLNVTKMIISVFDRIENIVGKGEIACTSNFSFPHNVC